MEEVKFANSDDGAPLPAALVCRRDDSEQLSALPQHAAVGLKTLGNDGNCCIVEAPPLGFETAVPVPPGATVAPGAVAVTDSWPTPVHGRPLSEFLPSAGWIKVLGSAGGTESSFRPERTVLFPLSTGLTVFPPSIEAPVFWASDKVVVAVRTRTLRPISSTRLAAMGRSPIRSPRTLNVDLILLFFATVRRLIAAYLSDASPLRGLLKTSARVSSCRTALGKS